mgnify:FL=1
MKDRKCYFIDIKSVQENDGRLLVVEHAGNPLPFDIKRIFWVRDVITGARRGEHATKKTKLVLIPIAGNCDVEVDDGTEKKTYHMDDPTKGLYIDEMIWRTMKNFSADCVMMAVCDRVFEPGEETFDDYNEFLEALKRE